MKRITTISLIVAIMIIISTLSSINAVQINGKSETLKGSLPIGVSKKIWDGTEWSDSATCYFGDSVLFNVTITYFKNCNDGVWATEIQMIDTLPSFLEYNNSMVYKESYIQDNKIYWNLSDVFGIFLEENESVSVEYEAIVVEYGESNNFVEVNAFEAGCNNELYGYDDVDIDIIDPIILKKEVYDPILEEWVNEYYGHVTKTEPVLFRINITYVGYYDISLMKCMLIEDFLPDCCLEYIGNEEYTYPDNMLFHDPTITVSEDLKHITYDWTNKKFNLYAGESIIIEFEAKVVDYSYNIVENCAFVELWNCLNCPNPIILEDNDCAKVNCFPPDSFIEKKVKDPDSGEWVEDISVFVGDVVTNKIMLTYYGNYDFSDITIYDNLHCTTDYVDGSATIPISGQSEKMIWWNFTGPLNDSETIEIQFQTEAISGTGCGSAANIASFEAYEEGKKVTDSDNAFVKVISNSPPFNPDITGEIFGYEGDELFFRAITIDPDFDQVYYMFDWDDGTYSEWLGPYDSGDEAQISKIWEEAGEYDVRAKAKDSSLEEESDWSFYPVIVEIDEPLVPQIDIIFKPGLGLTLRVNLKNTGEVNFENVNWELTVLRRGIIQRVLWQSNGIISDFPIDKIVTIDGKPSGIGLITATMRVEAPGVDPVEFSVDGFIFSRLVYLT